VERKGHEKEEEDGSGRRRRRGSGVEWSDVVLVVVVMVERRWGAPEMMTHNKPSYLNRVMKIVYTVYC